MAEKQEAGAEHAAGHGSHGGHGHGAKQCHCHEEGHEGAPEWLISFADNVALMMGFFVVLLAMNLRPPSAGTGDDPNMPGHEADGAAMLDWVLAIRESFNNPVRTDSTSPSEAPLVQRLLTRGKSGKNNDLGLSGEDLDVRTIRRAEHFTHGGTVLFEQGSAELTDEARAELSRLLERLRGIRSVLELRGHASAAEAYRRTDRAMQLAYDRTRATAEFLVGEGLDWRQLRLVALGDSDRITASAHSPLEHASNQRVEVIVSDDGANTDEP